MIYDTQTIQQKRWKIDLRIKEEGGARKLEESNSRHSEEEKYSPKISEGRVQAFWGRIKASDKCWNWTRGTDGHGYGTFRLENYPHKAHRISYFLSNGPFPKRLSVLHTCDNPLCCNPKHLFLGTQLENIRDMDAKGRRNPATGVRTRAGKNPELMPRGEDHPMVKLTEDQVLKIRKGVALGASQRSFSRMYGVCPQLICSIVKRKVWRHLVEVDIS